MKRLSLLAAVLLAASVSLQAKVTLPPFIGSHMVLQQNAKVALWGKATPGATVIITPKWDNPETVSAKVDADGNWSARLQTPSAGGPYTIYFVEGETLAIKDVLIGEVWFCSGQSNMEMPVKGFGGQPVIGGTEAILTAGSDVPIRMCTIKKKVAYSEQSEATGSWQRHAPDAVAECSATAYFFGAFLQKALGVPVGLLIADWGGTPIESWMDKETLESGFAGEFDFAHLNGGPAPEQPQYKPGTLFNGMVAPVVPFTFKGMIWYQGCSNKGRHEQYGRLQPAYVKMMRERFDNPDAPFYFVQLAPYPYGRPDDYSLGYICEAQQHTLEKIPHSGMATTADIGEFGTIHPCHKREVGERLAWLAMRNDYGVTAIDPTAPIYESMTVKDGKVVLTFKVDNSGLAPQGQDLTGFEVAGADKVFHPATGRVGGKSVIVSCPEVADPVAVRYCMHNWSVGTLFNTCGMPAGPFRTDDWDI